MRTPAGSRNVRSWLLQLRNSIRAGPRAVKTILQEMQGYGDTDAKLRAARRYFTIEPCRSCTVGVARLPYILTLSGT